MHLFPGGPNDKESTCKAGDTGDISLISGSGSFPGGGHGNPLEYSCLESPTDRAAWGVRVCPWSHKEWDTTGQLNMHTHVYLGLSRTFPTRILSSSISNPAFKFLCILPVPPDLTGPCIWTLWQMPPRSHPGGWLGFICW